MSDINVVLGKDGRFRCAKCESLRAEVAALRRVVESLPKCEEYGCQSVATNMTCAGDFSCDQHKEAGCFSAEPLPYRAALLALGGGK